MRIVFDGIDGAGKSTLVESFYELPLPDDFDFEICSFPTAIPRGSDAADDISRALYHLQDFHTELQRKHRHENLVFDRSFVTTLAYQGFQRGSHIDLELYESIMMLGSRIFMESPVHDVAGETLFFHVTCDVEEAIRRIRSRGEARDEVDRASTEWQREFLTHLKQRLELIYADLQRRYQGRYPLQFFTLDTTDTTAEDGLSVLWNLLGPHLLPDQPHLPLE